MIKNYVFMLSLISFLGYTNASGQEAEQVIDSTTVAPQEAPELPVTDPIEMKEDQEDQKKIEAAEKKAKKAEKAEKKAEKAKKKAEKKVKKQEKLSKAIASKKKAISKDEKKLVKLQAKMAKGKSKGKLSPRVLPAFPKFFIFPRTR